MLWGRKKTIENTNLLHGMTDYHCHILPGVDDGVKTMEESLSILNRYEELGIEAVWFTPHVMSDLQNTIQSLKERFEDFKQAYKGNVSLNLSAEYMLDEGFLDLLENDDILTHALSDHILVETSYFNPPADLMSVLETIKSKGYFPVLAHPERYMYMDDNMYQQIKDLEVRFQLNLGSLSGCYGKHVRKKALKMLKKHWYQYVGTDLHTEGMLDMVLDAEVPSKMSEYLGK